MIGERLGGTAATPSEAGPAMGPDEALAKATDDLPPRRD
jgi:hypothetical protein